MKEGWQKRALAVLHAARPSGALRSHLRKRLDRWEISVLPGYRVERAMSVLKSLGNSSSPRVWAVVFKTFCNGWVTDRRFQSTGPCRFCQNFEDSLEHYAHCASIANWFQCYAGLAQTPAADRLEEFLCLSLGATSLNPHQQDYDEVTLQLSLRGLALHALHKTANLLRHGQLAPSGSEQAFRALIVEAARGDPKAVSSLQTARRRRRP